MTAAAGDGVRTARLEDAHGIALVHVESWRKAYRGLIDQALLDSLDVGQRAAGWSTWLGRSLASMPTDGGESAPHRMLVAESDHRIVGWASFGAGRDPGQRDHGELAGLYVHPDWWSRGVGHSLLARVEHELRADGFTRAYLWVLHGNRRAIRFYDRHMWRADGAEKVGDAGGAHDLLEARHARDLSECIPA